MLWLAWLACAPAGPAAGPSGSPPVTPGSPTGLGTMTWTGLPDLQPLDLAVTTAGDVCIAGVGWPPRVLDASQGMLLRVAADGQVATAHGNGGIVRAGSAFPHVAAGPDNSCFVADEVGFDGDYYADEQGDTVKRYTAAGVRDPAFTEWVNALDATGDQGIVDLAGLAGGGALVLRQGEESAMAVVRLLPDGAPDPAFGVGGVAALPVPVSCAGTSLCDLGAVLALEDGGVLAAVGHPASLVRLDGGGALVLDYGTAGVATTSGVFRVQSAVVDLAGSTWLAGSVSDGSGKWPPTITYVEAWDAGGAVALPPTALALPSRIQVVDLAVRDEGGIVLLGYASYPGDHATVLLWLDESGALDPTAAGAGIETVWEPARASVAVGLEGAGDGTLVGVSWDGVEMIVFAR